MTTLAKDLAAGVAVECSTMAFTLRRSTAAAARWDVVIDDGTVRPADHVIITTPLAQAFGLLADADLELDVETFRVDYDRTICLLAALDRPTVVSSSGGTQPADGVFSFIGDNMSKGVSTAPAITFHADPTWSDAHWDEPVDVLGPALIDAARPWLGDAVVVEHQVKKWRFATPRTISPDPCRTLADGSIVLAGDAFAGPRIEGAHNSGLAAAHTILG